MVSGQDEARQKAAKFMVPSIGVRSIDVGTNIKRAAGLKLIGNSLILGIIELISEAFTLADKSSVGSDLIYDFIQVEKL